MIDEASMDLTLFLVPWIALLISLVATLWIKEWVTSLVKGMKFRMNKAFNEDEMELNGQKFLFKPRPTKPLLYIAGSKGYSIKRAVKHGDGWIPIAREPEDLIESLGEYKKLCDVTSKSTDKISVVSWINPKDKAASAEKLKKFKSMGIERLICGLQYNNVDDYLKQLDLLKSLKI